MMAASAFHMNFEDKVVLVTGGAAGIGAGIVRALVAENARCVVFLDVKEREGSTLETELYQKFGALRAKFIKCDISDEEQLDTAFSQVFDKYHKFDAVINNAAILCDENEAYKRMININFAATVSSTFKAIEIMGADKAGGVVLNISSLMALQHSSHLPVYTATKVAVLQFSNSVGTEEYYSKTNVRVVSVCLGPTDTAILQRHNFQNFDKDCVWSLSSHISERQRVESAVMGILDVLKRGESGSTWIVANDKPAIDISQNVRQGFNILSQTPHD